MRKTKYVFKDGSLKHVMLMPQQQQLLPQPPSTMNAKLILSVHVRIVTAPILIMRSGTCMLRATASTTTATVTAAMVTSGTVMKASSLGT